MTTSITPTPTTHTETEELTPETIQGMTQEQRLEQLNKYRKLVNEGIKLSQIAHSNAIAILRAVRSRAIEMNPRAKKATKKKAEASFDLSKFLNKS